VLLAFLDSNSHSKRLFQTPLLHYQKPTFSFKSDMFVNKKKMYGSSFPSFLPYSFFNLLFFFDSFPRRKRPTKRFFNSTPTMPKYCNNWAGSITKLEQDLPTRTLPFNFCQAHSKLVCISLIQFYFSTCLFLTGFDLFFDYSLTNQTKTIPKPGI